MNTALNKQPINMTGDLPKALHPQVGVRRTTSQDMIDKVDSAIATLLEETCKYITGVVLSASLSDKYSDARNKVIVELYAEDIPSVLLADKFGVSQRTIQRIIQKYSA